MKKKYDSLDNSVVHTWNQWKNVWILKKKEFLDFHFLEREKRANRLTCVYTCRTLECVFHAKDLKNSTFEITDLLRALNRVIYSWIEKKELFLVLKKIFFWRERGKKSRILINRGYCVCCMCIQWTKYLGI